MLIYLFFFFLVPCTSDTKDYISQPEMVQPCVSSNPTTILCLPPFGREPLLFPAIGFYFSEMRQ